MSIRGSSHTIRYATDKTETTDTILQNLNPFCKQSMWKFLILAKVDFFRMLRRERVIVKSFNTLLRYLVLLALVCVCVSGCASKMITDVRRVSTDPVTKRFHLTSSNYLVYSKRAKLTLRTYDLEKSSKTDTIATLVELQNHIRTGPTPDLLFTFAEISYFEAKNQEEDNPKLAAEIYIAGILHAYQYLFDPSMESRRNQYDDQFRDVCVIYNNSLLRILRIMGNENELFLKPDNSYLVQTPNGSCKITCVMNSPDWNAEEIEKFKFTADYKIQGLQNDFKQYGIGVPLIAIRKHCPTDSPLEKYYPSGLCLPMTAFLRVVRSDPANFADDLSCNAPESEPALNLVLELHDPMTATHTRVGNCEVPLESDLTTPLAYFLSNPVLNTLGTIGFLRPDLLLQNKILKRPAELIAQANGVKRDGEFKSLKPRQKNGVKYGSSKAGNPEASDEFLQADANSEVWGIYMTQPYDPDKIPVVMVHGLWSTPITWMELFNSLRSIPEIRENYQFWFYFYPSAQPFWVSASQLREDLAEVRRTLSPNRDTPALERMVLVGHSMGGLISRMQTLDSGDRVWKLVSDIPFEEIEESPEVKEEMENWFFFTPNQSVDQVITIATPFAGSDASNNTTQWLSGKLIRLPHTLTNIVSEFTTKNDETLKTNSLLKIKTSVESLAPKNPLFPLLVSNEHQSDAHYHNIVGDQFHGPILEYFNAEGDGVVKLSSAAAIQAESLITVPSSHSSVHSHPKAIMEVRRILLNNLRSKAATVAMP